MEQLFRVAIHYENDNGYIEYDTVTKKATVVLAHEGKRKEVENYLRNQHIVSTPVDTIKDFKDVVVVPTDSLENLKLVLTRMWVSTSVLVDWSRPVHISVE